MKEYLKKLLAAKQANNAKIKQLMAKSVEAGETPDEETEAQIQDLESQNAVIEKNIARTEAQIKESETETKAPAGAPKIEIVTAEKGVGYAQYARAKVISRMEAKKGNYVSPAQVAKHLGFSQEVQDLATKALGTTTDSAYAAPLVAENRLVGEFVDLVKANSILDKLQGAKRVPFNAKIPAKATRGTASWVGEGERKPVTNATFKEVEIKSHKLAAISIFTQELLMRSDPSVDLVVRDDLVEAAQILIDETFISNGAGTAVRPEGIFYNVTPIASTGTTAEAYQNDLLTAIGEFISNNLDLNNAYWLMDEVTATKLTFLRTPTGAPFFEGMGDVARRNLLGVPVVVSNTVQNMIGLVKMSEILLADDGVIDVDYNDVGSVTDGGVTHNLWQENKIAVRVEKFITWAKRRPIAATYISYAEKDEGEG